jgi:hypothetical protein
MRLRQPIQQQIPLQPLLTPHRCSLACSPLISTIITTVAFPSIHRNREPYQLIAPPILRLCNHPCRHSPPLQLHRNNSSHSHHILINNTLTCPTTMTATRNPLRNRPLMTTRKSRTATRRPLRVCLIPNAASSALPTRTTMMTKP